MAAVLAVEVNTDDHNRIPAVTSPVQKSRKTFYFVGSVLGATLMMGVLFGALIASHVAGSDDLNPKCVDDMPSDVTSELDAGISTIEEWFPESAATIRANKVDIIKQMVSLEDPPANSILQKVKLFTSKPAVTENNERRLQVGPSPCVAAVTDFFVALMNWVAGWVKLTIPDGNQFRADLLLFVGSTKKANFEAQVSHIMNFVLAEGAAQKTTDLWKLINKMHGVGGGPVKFMMKWINEHTAKPWEATKMVVKLAAQLTQWLGQGAARFTATATLQVMGTPGILNSGKKTVSICKPAKKPSDDGKDPLVADDSK